MTDRIIWVYGEPKPEDDAVVNWAYGEPYNPLITEAATTSSSHSIAPIMGILIREGLI